MAGAMTEHEDASKALDKVYERSKANVEVSLTPSLH